MKVVTEDVSKILSRADITESTQRLSAKKQKEVVLYWKSNRLILFIQYCRWKWFVLGLLIVVGDVSSFFWTRVFMCLMIANYCLINMIFFQLFFIIVFCFVWRPSSLIFYLLECSLNNAHFQIEMASEWSLVAA